MDDAGLNANGLWTGKASFSQLPLAPKLERQLEVKNPWFWNKSLKINLAEEEYAERADWSG